MEIGHGRPAISKSDLDAYFHPPKEDKEGGGGTKLLPEESRLGELLMVAMRGADVDGRASFNDFYAAFGTAPAEPKPAQTAMSLLAASLRPPSKGGPKQQSALSKANAEILTIREPNRRSAALRLLWGSLSKEEQDAWKGRALEDAARYERTKRWSQRTTRSQRRRGRLG